jgi:hypothetical protein
MVKRTDMEQDRNNPTPNNERHDLYVDEKTREKIRKHYSDPNDKITEEDIANVNTDIYARPATEEEDREIDKLVEEETPRKAPSAWDISTND